MIDHGHIRDRLNGRLATLDGGPAARVEAELIRSALERMDRDDFGWCARCCGPIEEARLEAVPYAVLCGACRDEAKHRRALGPAPHGRAAEA